MRIEVVLFKVGKLATPAAAVLAGGVLMLNGQPIPGAILCAAGVISYLAVWCWATDAAKKVAREGVKKERLRNERVIASASVASQRYQLQQASMKEKLAYKFAGKLMDLF